MAVLAVGLALNEAHDRGYNKATEEIEAELATSANEALLAQQSIWEARLETERERAQMYQEEARRLQSNIDRTRQLTVADIRAAMEGLVNVTSDSTECRLGANFIGLHNTAAGHSDDSGSGG